MEDEIWVKAFGWDGLYEVSSAGRVRSIVRTGRTSLGDRKYGGKILTPIVRKVDGYLVVNLTNKTIRKQVLLHALILKSFEGDAPAGMECCHNDGSKANNAIENLRWDTRRGNHADKKAHGTWQGGENCGTSKLTDELVRYIRASPLNHQQMADELGVHKSCIEKVRLRVTWRHID